MLFNTRSHRNPSSITFVAGKNQITIFGDGIYIGGTSADVPVGEPLPGTRPRFVDETAAWETALHRLYNGASNSRLIA